MWSWERPPMGQSSLCQPSFFCRYLMVECESVGTDINTQEMFLIVLKRFLMVCNFIPLETFDDVDSITEAGTHVLGVEWRFPNASKTIPFCSTLNRRGHLGSTRFFFAPQKGTTPQGTTCGSKEGHRIQFCRFWSNSVANQTRENGRWNPSRQVSVSIIKSCE